MRWKSTFMMFTVLGLAINASAQSNQYKRPEKKDAPVVTPKAAGKSKDAKAASGKVDAKASTADSQKLNIEDLEKRYWAPKDTEFKVVQNRKFTKKDRYNLTLLGGLLINDAFISGKNIGISGSYYRNEYHGIELRLETYSNTLGEAGKQVLAKGGDPDVNYEKAYLGVAYSYIPFYGKISVLDTKIVYFDMALSAGLGLIRYEQQAEASVASLAKTKNAIALNLDVSQQYFLSQNWALRLDLRTRIYNEERIVYKTGVSQGNKLQINTNIMFGVTYFH